MKVWKIASGSKDVSYDLKTAYTRDDALAIAGKYADNLRTRLKAEGIMATVTQIRLVGDNSHVGFNVNNDRTGKVTDYHIHEVEES